MSKLVLIANPGSASRKYSLYLGSTCILDLHFELIDKKVVCGVNRKGIKEQAETNLRQIAQSPSLLIPMIEKYAGLSSQDEIADVGVRIVAPSGFFMEDRVMTDQVIKRLEALEDRAPLHIKATLDEIRRLQRDFPEARIVGISDSSFHSTKPDYAWNYGLPIQDADKLEIKRFGYHGISVGSVVRSLDKMERLAPKVVVCHIGSGVSITAVKNGKSLDNTMGYSPLEGLIMSTRVGSLDITAYEVIKTELRLSQKGLNNYLNNDSGLLGLSSRSSDIRELLRLEKSGDTFAALALATFVYNIQKGIGQMVSALNGIDVLVFTATVGERSAVIRRRITKNLEYLDLLLDSSRNKTVDATSEASIISEIAKSKPIIAMPSNETEEMLRRLLLV